MNRSILRYTFFSILVIFCSYSIGLAQSISYKASILDDAIETSIVAAPQESIRAYLLLKDQVDIPALNAQFNSLRASKDQRARTVVQQLKKKAQLSQKDLLRELQNHSAVKPESIEAFWITNMILVEATGAYLAELSFHPAIQRIEQEFVASLHHEPAGKPLDLTVAPNGRERALTTIQAHKLWELGYTGYGTKVMVIDTDIDFNHRALKTQFFYNNAPLEQSFTGEISGQICFSHGTNVVGLIVGLDRSKNDTVGVAFNAKYINGPVPFFDGDGNQCELEGKTLSAVENLQFALDPDGNPNTTSDIPDVVNNSYGSRFNSSRDCDNISLRNIYSSLDAAGVSLVFSAGNEGPEASSLSVQASLNFDLLVPFVVGSVDNNNSISDFSSRGPSICIDGPDMFKPEVVAPGNQVRTTKPFNNYESVPGTSFSTPYVAGAILLLKEAFPNLTGRQLNEALMKSATDLGPAGEDNAYGAGLINVFAAYNWLIDQGNAPTPALRSANDAILVDAETRNQDCNRMIQAFITVANNGTEAITNLEVSFQKENDRSNLGTATWTGNIQPGTMKKIAVAPVNAFVGNYTVQIGIEKVNGRADLRALDNFIKSEVQVSDDPVEPTLTIAGQQICKGGQSMLITDSDLTGSIRWYDALEGGNIIAEGNTVLLENVQKDTTLYVSIASIDKVGLERADLGPNTFLSQQAGLVFDADAAFTLKSVKVFAEASGPRIFQLKDTRGNVQQKVTSLSATGEQRVELNFKVLPGQDYELLMTLGSGLSVTTNQTSFPYKIDGLLSINRSKGTVATFYAYFYDWEVEYDYNCGRVVAAIEVDENGVAPVVDFSADKTVADIGPDGTAIVRFTNLTEGLVSYTWNFGDGFTSNQANPSNAYSQSGTYNVTLYGTNADGCSSMAVKTIEITNTTTTREQQVLANQIELFPNPARNQINLRMQFSGAKEVRYEIVDLLGKGYGQYNLGKTADFQEPISIEYLPAGTYVLMLEIDGIRVGKRLVKLN